MKIDDDTRRLMFFAAFDLFHRCTRPCRQAVVFVGFLLVGGEGRDAGAIGGLDDGIEVERYGS